MTESQHALQHPQFPPPEKPMNHYPVPQVHHVPVDLAGNPSPHPNGAGTTLQQASQRVRDLEEQNARLYHDNCQLASTVQMLKERHLFVSKPQVIQLQQFAYIQELLRITEANRLIIAQQQQDLLASITSDTVSQQLAVQMQQTRLEHTQLFKEYSLMLERYTRLKSHYAMVSLPNLPPQSVPVSSPASTVVPSHAQNSNPVTVPQRSDRQPSGDFSRDVSLSLKGSQATSSHVYQNVPFQQQTQQFHGDRWVSENFTQPSVEYSHRSAPPLPTPPPSASMAAAPSPRGFPPNVPTPKPTARPHISIPSTSTMFAPPTMQVPLQLRQPFTQDFRSARGAPQFIDLTTEELISTPILSSDPGIPQISPTSTSNHLKRPSSAVDAPVAPGVDPKRPRTGEACQPSAGVISPNPSQQQDKFETAQITLPLLPVASPSSEVNQNGLKSTIVHQKGLRSPEECIELIFEQDTEVENGIYCEACWSRYDAGMLAEPPGVLINPDFDFLVKHCTTFHPTLWEDLQQRNDQA